MNSAPVTLARALGAALVLAATLALAASCGPGPRGPKGPPPQYDEPQDPVWPPTDAGNISETSP